MTLYAFLSGATTLGFLLAGLYFLRFWTQTRDRLFLAFGVAFWLLGLNQGLTVLVFWDTPAEDRSWLYLLRLAAFLLIIVAVFDKNRKR